MAHPIYVVQGPFSFGAYEGAIAGLSVSLFVFEPKGEGVFEQQEPTPERCLCGSVLLSSRLPH